VNRPPETVLLAHGSGGLMSHSLISELFVRHFHNDILSNLGDSALLDAVPQGATLAFTTDSYVISPLFFPGGDIGKLAVCGTVNDLAVAGATPRYLSAGFVLEEGLSMDILGRVVISMAETASKAGVQIVTGDTKVVERGAADGLFINTSGIGCLPSTLRMSPSRLRAGDVILASGTLGDHGIAVMLNREGMGFQSDLLSDCAPLNGLIADLTAACPDGIRCMRDPTRGGLVATLHEWAESADQGIEIDEDTLPIRESVRAACELLGLDPLYAANEGKVIVGAASHSAEAALRVLRAHPLGCDAAIIGHVTEQHPRRVVLRTPYGAQRLLDMLVGDQLPRIC